MNVVLAGIQIKSREPLAEPGAVGKIPLQMSLERNITQDTRPNQACLYGHERKSRAQHAFFNTPSPTLFASINIQHVCPSSS